MVSDAYYSFFATIQKCKDHSKLEVGDISWIWPMSRSFPTLGLTHLPSPFLVKEETESQEVK